MSTEVPPATRAAAVPHPPGSDRMTAILLRAGVAAAVVYVVGDVLTGLGYRGYSFTDQWISELTALDSPVRPVMLGVLTAHGLLLAALGWGVLRAAGPVRSLRWSGALLIGSAGVGFFVHVVFPMSGRTGVAGFTDSMHASLSAVWGVLTFAAMILVAVAHRGWLRVLSTVTVLVMLGSGVASSVAIQGLAVGHTPWAGTFERINAYGLMLWLTALAVATARRRSGTAAGTGGLGSVLRRRPVLAYCTIAFGVSWIGFLLVGGSGFVLGTSWRTDLHFWSAVAVMLLGPPVAGLSMTLATAGPRGLRTLLRRLGHWRVPGSRYAAALLAAPLATAVVVLPLAAASPAYLPGVATSDDVGSLLLVAAGVGLLGGLLEELGWTGFAVPALRKRHNEVATGLTVGLLWTAWHLLQMIWVGRETAGSMALWTFLPLYFLSAAAQLTGYRMLMTWVYDRTGGSLLLAVLMHASYIVSTLFVFSPAAVAGGPFLVHAWLLALALWIVVGAVTLVDRRRRLPAAAAG